MKKMLMAIGLSLLLCFGSITTVDAKDQALNFEWEQIISTDFSGWKLYYGTTSSNYTQMIEVPYVSGGDGTYTTTEIIIVPDAMETELFFALTSNDFSGNESMYSNEVSVIIDALSPGTPFNLIITILIEE